MAGMRARLLAGVGVLAWLLLPVGGAAAPAVGEGAMLDETTALFRALTDARLAPPVTIGFRRRLVDAAEMRSAAAAIVRGAYSPAQVALQQKMWQRLGLLPAGADYLSLLERAAPHSPTGFYDPDARRLYVGDWIALTAQRSTLAHELAHALQDQRFGLRRFLRLRPADAPALDFDAALARQALVEGDAAVLAMEAIDARGRFPSQLELAAIERRMRALATAPDHEAPPAGEPAAEGHEGPSGHAVESSTLGSTLSSSLASALVGPGSAFVAALRSFPYVDGFSFVADVRATSPWSAVDALWSEPPESTAEILHPEKLAHREPPLAFAVTALPSLAAGRAATHVDTLGEYVVRLWLQPAASAPVVERAATGWRGDRIAVYLPEATPAPAAGDREGDGGEATLAWLTVWDSPADADDFLRAAGVRLAQLAGHETLASARRALAPEHAAAPAPERADGWIALSQERAGGSLFFAAQRRGDRVALLLGAPEASLPALGAMLDDWKAAAPAPPPAAAHVEATGHAPASPARRSPTRR